MSLGRRRGLAAGHDRLAGAGHRVHCGWLGRRRSLRVRGARGCGVVVHGSGFGGSRRVVVAALRRDRVRGCRLWWGRCVVSRRLGARSCRRLSRRVAGRFGWDWVVLRLGRRDGVVLRRAGSRRIMFVFRRSLGWRWVRVVLRAALRAGCRGRLGRRVLRRWLVRRVLLVLRSRWLGCVDWVALHVRRRVFRLLRGRVDRRVVLVAR